MFARPVILVVGILGSHARNLNMFAARRAEGFVGSVQSLVGKALCISGYGCSTTAATWLSLRGMESCLCLLCVT